MSWCNCSKMSEVLTGAHIYIYIYIEDVCRWHVFWYTWNWNMLKPTNHCILIPPIIIRHVNHLKHIEPTSMSCPCLQMSPGLQTKTLSPASSPTLSILHLSTWVRWKTWLTEFDLLLVCFFFNEDGNPYVFRCNACCLFILPCEFMQC